MASDWRKTARDRATSLKEGNSFKLIEGTNCFRIMPDKRGVKHAPYMEILVHRDVGPDNWFGRCGREMDGSGKCWLCDKKIPELQASPSSSKKAMAEALAADEQMICQVSRYDPDTRRFSAPKPWWVSNARTVRPLLLSKIADSRYSFDDPVKGYNLVIERSGTGPRNTVYDPPVRDEEQTKVPQEILNQIKPWGAFVPVYNEDDMQAAYYGKLKDRREETSSPARSTKGKPARSRAAEEEQEEVEDTEPEDEEVEEEPEEEKQEEEEQEEEEQEEETEEETEEEEQEEVEEEETEEESEEEEQEEEEQEEEEQEQEQEQEEEEEEEEEPRRKIVKTKAGKKPAKPAKKSPPPPPPKKKIKRK